MKYGNNVDIFYIYNNYYIYYNYIQGYNKIHKIECKN